MPTFDGGHCFLTTLIPINSENVVVQDGLHYSHVQLVRNALAVMPTAHQSPASDRQPCNSPFARCTKTHFARIVVLNDVIYNGRMPVNTLLEGDPTIPQPIDTLPTPYLFFNADFDAPQGTPAELREWLRGVWTKMRVDLDPVFEHCFQYTAKVKDADSFADYMAAHMIDTTMPFNDYWPVNPPVATLLPTLSTVWLGVAALATWAVVGFGLWWLLRLLHLAASGGFWRGLEIALVVLIGLGAALYVAYTMIMRAGLKRFPMAPNSDLPSILKGLYLQRGLIPLVAHLQGFPDQDLFNQMGAFLAAARLDNLEAPTQAPGTIGK